MGRIIMAIETFAKHIAKYVGIMNKHQCSYLYCILAVLYFIYDSVIMSVCIYICLFGSLWRKIVNQMCANVLPYSLQRSQQNLHDVWWSNINWLTCGPEQKRERQRSSSEWVKCQKTKMIKLIITIV